VTSTTTWVNQWFLVVDQGLSLNSASNVYDRQKYSRYSTLSLILCVFSCIYMLWNLSQKINENCYLLITVSLFVGHFSFFFSSFAPRFNLQFCVRRGFTNKNNSDDDVVQCYFEKNFWLCFFDTTFCTE